MGRLSPAEATAWLARADREAQVDAADLVDVDARSGGPFSFGPAGATLAELFALHAGTTPATITEPTPGTAAFTCRPSRCSVAWHPCGR